MCPFGCDYEAITTDHGDGRVDGKVFHDDGCPAIAGGDFHESRVLAGSAEMGTVAAALASLAQAGQLPGPVVIERVDDEEESG